MFRTTLSYNKMRATEKRAYVVWAGQRQRCNDKNHPKYYTYGAKGIKVKYSSREFVNWYLKNTKGLDLAKIAVGRIDHACDYCLENIEIQTRSENSKERIRRLGQPKKERRIAIYRADDMTLVGIAFNGKIAAAATNISHCNISGFCQGRFKKSRNGFTFRYHEESL